jgi:hypothetical protein
VLRLFRVARVLRLLRVVRLVRLPPLKVGICVHPQDISTKDDT